MATLLDAAALPAPPRDTPSPGNILLGRVVTALLVVGPVVALAIAIPLLWGGRGTCHRYVIITVAFYLVSGFGVTVGYHRLFTRRNFHASRWLRIVLASAGSLAVEGSLDGLGHEPPAPSRVQRPAGRSPLAAVARPGCQAAQFRGSTHTHVGWLFKGDVTSAARYAPELLADADHADHQPAVPCLRGVLARGAVLPRVDVVRPRSVARSPRSCGPASPAWCCCTT